MTILMAFSLLSLSSCSSTGGQRNAVSVTIDGSTKSHFTLEEAVASIPDGSVAVITVNSDQVLSGQITFPQGNITLKAGEAPVTISRAFSDAGANRMFVLTGSTNLTIEGPVRIVGSRDEENSADRQVFLVGKDESDSKVALFLNDGVTVCDNSTSSDGGAALVHGKVVVNGATVSGNSSSSDGGAFALKGSTDFRIYSGEISSNSAGNGGAISIRDKAYAVLSKGSIKANSASGLGGNVYLAGGVDGIALGGGISITDGRQGGADNDITMADGSPDSPTTMTITGKFTVGEVNILGKDVRFKLSAFVGASTFHVVYDGTLTEEERFALLDGPCAGTQFGALRFEEGPMFNDPENVVIQFWASPIKESGWGDCPYIEFPDGTNMLVDCATEDTGLEIAKKLWAAGVYKIDVCLLTHYHSDHANGFQAILEDAKISVGRFISTSYIPSAGAYNWITSDLRTYGGQSVYVAAGDSFDLGGAHFSILWPNAEQLTPVPAKTSTDEGKAYTDDDPPVLGGSLDMNSKTIVMMMQYGTTKVLFCGDIYANRIAYNGAQDWDYTAYDNKNSEEYLVKQYEGTDTLDADLMVAAHHGKKTSYSETLIQAVTPKYAIAMGTANQTAIKDRYEAYGATFIRTGSTAYEYNGHVNQSVYAILDGTDIRIQIGQEALQ